MVKNRNAVIEKLKKEGVFSNNKNLKMPMLPKRVAVISVETSKGFSDFITTLNNNRYGYAFKTELFPSILQGDKAITGITNCLNEIEKRQRDFDCVVIVRGGGGDVGLSCYDDYGLSRCVATFPLPVLTGIGHSTNLSVTDMVAHTYHITPTEVAFSLIHCFLNFDEKLQDYQNRIVERAKLILTNEKTKLLELDAQRKIAAPKVLGQYQNRLNQLSQMIVMHSKELFLMQRMALDNITEKMALLHPDNILKRGFSVTRFNGKAVTSADKLPSGAEIVTKLYDGEVTSVVK